MARGTMDRKDAERLFAHRRLAGALLKWLDEPCPFFDWHAREGDDPIVHPDDAPEMAAMAVEFDSGEAAHVLRLRALDGGWTPIHVTVRRVEVAADTYATFTDPDVKPAQQ